MCETFAGTEWGDVRFRQPLSAKFAPLSTTWFISRYQSRYRCYMNLPQMFDFFTPLPSCHRWFGFRPEERLLGIVLVHFNFFALRVSDDELSSVHPRHSISLISLKIGDQLLYCGKAARREKLILHYNCNLGFGDRVNAMKMKSCYSAPHYVLFRVTSLALCTKFFLVLTN